MKAIITEDFDYNKLHIMKDTPCLLKDLKIVNMARTGIGALVQIHYEKEGSEQKTYVEDWIDLGLVFPFKSNFTVPHGTDPVAYRNENMDKEDKRLVDSWKALIENGEKDKVIKIISTRLSSEKFGL